MLNKTANLTICTAGIVTLAALALILGQFGFSFLYLMFLISAGAGILVFTAAIHEELTKAQGETASQVTPKTEAEASGGKNAR